MRLGVAAAICFAAITGAAAQQHEEAVAMGPGVSTCAEFAEAYRSDPKHVIFFYFAWAQGLMSGANMVKKAIDQPQRDLNGLPTEEQMDRLRNFCDQRPLAHFGDAVWELFYELPQIHRQPN